MNIKKREREEKEREEEGVGEGTHETFEMLHEDLQRDVVREDGLQHERVVESVRLKRSSIVRERWQGTYLAGGTAGAVRAPGHMSGGRVELGEKEAGLRAALIGRDIARDRVAIRQQVLYHHLEVSSVEEPSECREGTNLSVGDRRSEKLGEVLVPFLILVPGLAPLGDRLTVENEDVEEGVEEEDNVGLDRDRIEQDGLGRRVERVGHQGGLDHDERIVDVLSVQNMTGSGWETREVSGDQETRDRKKKREGRTGRRPSRLASC